MYYFHVFFLYIDVAVWIFFSKQMDLYQLPFSLSKRPERMKESLSISIKSLCICHWIILSRDLVKNTDSSNNEASEVFEGVIESFIQTDFKKLRFV